MDLANLLEENNHLRLENEKLIINRCAIMPISIGDESTYYIIKTGYTSRLLDKLNYDIKEKCKNTGTEYRSNGVYNISNEIVPLCTRVLSQEEKDEESDLTIDELYTDDVEENKKYLLKRTLFIKDGLWGDGIYIVNDCENICKKITDILDQSDINYDGTICLGDLGLGNVLKCIEILGNNLRYCGCLEVCGLYEINYIEKNGLKICMLTFDSESG